MKGVTVERIAIKINLCKVFSQTTTDFQKVRCNGKRDGPEIRQNFDRKRRGVSQMISFCVTICCWKLFDLAVCIVRALFSFRLRLHDELDLFPVMNVIVDQSGVFVSC